MDWCACGHDRRSHWYGEKCTICRLCLMFENVVKEDLTSDEVDLVLKSYEELTKDK